MCTETKLVYTDGSSQKNPETGKAQKRFWECERVKVRGYRCSGQELKHVIREVGPPPPPEDPRRASEPY